MLVDNIYDIEATALLATRMASTYPSIVLYDFKAAFPSISWKYLYELLKRIQVPETIRRYIQHLYRDAKHSIRYKGDVYEAFTISSGILQGCPLSAALFCLALDPLTRFILTRIPRNPLYPTTTLDAYMDDVATVLNRTIVQLPQLLHVFYKFKLAAGPGLNTAKCVLIPLWTMDIERAKEMVTRLLPDTASFTFKTYGKLLGVMIGPGAVDVAWNQSLCKYDVRILQIRAYRLGLANSIKLHNIHAFSTLSHVMQFDHNNKMTDKREREAHQRLTAAPRYAFTTSLLTWGKKIRLPNDLHTLPFNGRAAQYRTAKVTSNHYVSLADLLSQAEHMELGGDLLSEYLIEPSLIPWWHNCIMSQTAKTISIIDQLPGMPLPDDFARKKVQRTVANKIREHCGQEDPEHLLRRRLVRFLGEPSELFGIPNPLRVLEVVYSNTLCPYLISCLLKTWVNGWCTAHRFQRNRLPCLFGCGQHASDCIEHYAVCPIICGFYNQVAPLLPKLSEAETRHQFLALHAAPDVDHTLPAAVLLHVVFTTYETIRHQQRTNLSFDCFDRTAMLHHSFHLTRLKHPGPFYSLLQWQPFVQNAHTRP